MITLIKLAVDLTRTALATELTTDEIDTITLNARKEFNIPSNVFIYCDKVQKKAYIIKHSMFNISGGDYLEAKKYTKLSNKDKSKLQTNKNNN